MMIPSIPIYKGLHINQWLYVTLYIWELMGADTGQDETMKTSTPFLQTANGCVMVERKSCGGFRMCLKKGSTTDTREPLTRVEKVAVLSGCKPVPR
jgi:hypothetical protein